MMIAKAATNQLHALRSFGGDGSRFEGCAAGKALYADKARCRR